MQRTTFGNIIILRRQLHQFAWGKLFCSQFEFQAHKYKAAGGFLLLIPQLLDCGSGPPPSPHQGALKQSCSHKVPFPCFVCCDVNEMDFTAWVFIHTAGELNQPRRGGMCVFFPPQNTASNWQIQNTECFHCFNTGKAESFVKVCTVELRWQYALSIMRQQYFNFFYIK